MDILIKKKDIIIDKNFDGNCIFNLNINNVYVLIIYDF